MSVPPALTAQNTLGVTGILPVPPAFLVQQMDAVFPTSPDAVKIGMVASRPLIEAIGERLRLYFSAKHIVVDPVMVSTAAPACWTGGDHPDPGSFFPWQRSSPPNLP